MDEENEELESTEESDGVSDFNEDASSFSEQEWNTEVPLTEEEIQALIDELLQVESKAAEAQELLEEESLAVLKDEVKAELHDKFSGLELDLAVEEEISTYVGQWVDELDDLEDQSALLQERLDDAGIDLPDLFKWIEKQAPQGCTTAAWKKRTHWAGLHASEEAADAVRKAEKDLESLRPVKRHHGKFMEKGASGFLERKFAHIEGSDTVNQSAEGWESLDALLGNEADAGKLNGFGTDTWASVYLAATPQQAAHLGLPGADQVEEIADLEKCIKDPFIAAALATEKEIGLTEQQKKNMKKVEEEDDIKKARLMQRVIFKPKRAVRKTKIHSLPDVASGLEQSEGAGEEKNQENSSTPSLFQDGTASQLQTSIQNSAGGTVCQLQTPIQNPAGDADTATALFEDSVLQDPAENLLNDGKALVHGRDGCKPLFSDRNFEESDSLDCKPPKLHLKRSRDNEVSEDHHQKITKVVINIDSDEDQVLEERKEPVCRQSQTLLLAPATTGDDVFEGKMCTGMPNNLCSEPNKPSLEDTIDDESVFAGHKYAETRNVLQTAGLSHVGEEVLGNVVEDGNRLMCTICGDELSFIDVCKHPRFDIAVCKPCKKFYQSSPFSKDANGSENECCLCGNGGDVLMCDFCDKVVCQACISLNFGDEELQRSRYMEEWVCLCCNPEPLRPLIERFRKATEFGLIQGSEDNFSSDAESSDFRNGRKEKRRKRIRRIIDDDELEESTKMKQALEKERKERLDRLRESTMASTSNSIPISSSLQECVVNVARDADEEEVLIPLGISKFLKPHQIEGVRFMWENCIESLKKVKSRDPGNGCILAHSMGLGKTLQVIAFLYTVLKRKSLGLRTALIVTPVNVLHNWPDEFDKWSPPEMKPLRVYILDELSRNRRVDLLSNWQKTGGVMMIGYTAFRILSVGKHVKKDSVRETICTALQNPGPDILVCDEAHMIKNKRADITQALKQVKTQRRIALTGSPLQNNLMEYYCMVDFVREGFLGRPQDFKNRFQNPIENGQHADSTEYDVRCMKERTHVLHKQLTGFVQRKGASVVEKELPPKYIYVISVRLSPLQRALYNRFIQLFWLSNEQGSSEIRSRKSLFNTYHTLSKVWNHPDLLLVAKGERDMPSEDSMDDFICEDDEGISSDDATYDSKREDRRNGQHGVRKKELDGMNEINSLEWCSDLISDTQHGVLDYSGKLVLLLDILTMSSARGEKALVFSQSIPTLNLIETFLAKLPRPKGKNGNWRRDKEWYRLDGQTKAKERQRLVKQFNDSSNSKVQCVLISTRAGSLGINLQAANRVIILDGSWNPTHDIQALFRAWRFGQKRPVVVYRLLAYGTAEEKIYKRQVAKEGLAARVLDEQQVSRHSKMEELKVLFKLDDDSMDLPFSCASNCVQGQSESEMKRSAPLQMENHQSTSLAEFDVSNHEAPEDDIMTSLLIDHRPKWIVRIHQHETLLVDREDEKLTQEEQALAWEKFKRIVENSTVDWVQVNSESGEYATSQVQNSWAVSFQAAQSTCSAKFHAELLSSQNTKNNEHLKCTVCQHIIGWEHIVKGRPRGNH